MNDQMKNDTVTNGVSIAALSKPIDYAQITVLSLGFGVCAFGIVSNGLVLHVTKKSKSFPLQRILAIGDLIFCFCYILATPPRAVWVVRGMYKDQVPGYWCLIYPWVHCFNVGFVWPIVVTLAIAIERFIASFCPIWYRQNWEIRVKKQFTRLIYGCVAVTLVPGWVLAMMLAVKGNTTQRQGAYTRCVSVYGTGFPLAQSCVGVVAGILCAVLSCGALIVGKRKRGLLQLPPNDKYKSNQRKMERTVGAIVVFSLLLVTLPNLIRMLEALDVLSAFSDSVLDVVRRYFVVMMIINSALNFWLYILFNSQFRCQAMRFILGKENEVGSTTGRHLNNISVRSRFRDQPML